MGVDNVTAEAVDTRIRLIDQLWVKFEAQHEQIRAKYKEGYLESEYVRSDLFEITENTYVCQRSSLARYANNLRPAVYHSTRSLNDNGTRNTPKTSLPRIKLQNFSGSYEDWPSFRDLFLSVIGDNSALSDIERFHYLRSCLQGPAEKLIRPLTVTSENYERAWALLCERYENKRELIRSNFATFTAVAKMKAETAEELSRVFNAVTTAVSAQHSIGRPIESHGMDLFNHLVVELFDPRTRLEWESSTSDTIDPPSHAAFNDFITKRILALNAARPKTAQRDSETPRPAKTHVAKHGSEPQCACKGKHTLMTCAEFKAKSASDRRSVVGMNRLCYNCLDNHAVAKCQSTKNCFTCKSRHHTLLHEAYVSAPKPAQVSALSAVRRADDRKAVLLATARVTIADRSGDPNAVRVLIDQGSEVSIVAESLVQRLNLRRSHSLVSIFGIGGSKSGATRGKVTVKLTSVATGASISVVAFILPRLSLYQGSTAECATTWPHIQELPLADPQFLDNDPVELLLGAEVCSVILQEGIRKGGPQAPIAQKTTLGWVSGGCGAIIVGNRGSLQCTADHELIELVRRFWEQEAEPSAPAKLTSEEQRCEDLFARTHERTADGRYVVRLPFSTNPTSLAETRRPAERLLKAMERRGEQDSRFGELYRSFMKEYEDLQHMTAVSTSPDEDEQIHKCYLPHHGIFKEASSTTKLRVVYNGSQRTRSGESLNSHLLVGASLLPALTDVLLRWRWHRYALVSDIEKMYRQVLVHHDDRDFQRVFWRPDPTGPVREYRLNTVTYGLACAAFLAIRSLRQLAEDERQHYPRAATALLRDCYVDDVVSGADSISDAIALQSQLRDLCTAGGFPLRKWAANFEEILAGIPPEHRLQQGPHSWHQESHSTLGLLWHPSEDSFALAIRPRAVTAFTKRRVLAETARLFDPLGWLAPVVVSAKILIQSAWLRQLDWDTPLPSADAHRWELLFKELPLLASLRIKRWLGTGAGNRTMELHGFADASERGYAAAVYLRVSEDHAPALHLLAAKSKVAPVKQVSLPRLELCAATLLVNTRETLTRNTQSLHSTSLPLVRFESDATLDPGALIALENLRGQSGVSHPDAAPRRSVAARSWAGQSCRLRLQRDCTE